MLSSTSSIKLALQFHSSALHLAYLAMETNHTMYLISSKENLSNYHIYSVYLEVKFHSSSYIYVFFFAHYFSTCKCQQRVSKINYLSLDVAMQKSYFHWTRLHNLRRKKGKREKEKESKSATWWCRAPMGLELWWQHRDILKPVPCFPTAQPKALPIRRSSQACRHNAGICK